MSALDPLPRIGFPRRHAGIRDRFSDDRRRCLARPTRERAVPQHHVDVGLRSFCEPIPVVVEERGSNVWSVQRGSDDRPSDLRVRQAIRDESLASDPDAAVRSLVLDITEQERELTARQVLDLRPAREQAADAAVRWAKDEGHSRKDNTMKPSPCFTCGHLTKHKRLGPLKDLNGFQHNDACEQCECINDPSFDTDTYVRYSIDHPHQPKAVQSRGGVKDPCEKCGASGSEHPVKEGASQ